MGCKCSIPDHGFELVENQDLCLHNALQSMCSSSVDSLKNKKQVSFTGAEVCEFTREQKSGIHCPQWNLIGLPPPTSLDQFLQLLEHAPFVLEHRIEEHK